MRTRPQAGCSIGTSTHQPAEHRTPGGTIVLFDSAQPCAPSGRLPGVFTLSTVTSETTAGSAATASQDGARTAEVRLAEAQHSPCKLYRYTLRRTWTNTDPSTLAVEAGVSLEDVAAGLGHTNTSTLKATYLHNAVAPGARRANAAINGRAA